ncbi:MAG: putative glycoside hydrolase [Gaiellaceae bacterium]
MHEPDSNVRFRERRRRRRRRQVRIRRAVAVGVLLALAAGVAVGARTAGRGKPQAHSSHTSRPTHPSSPKPATRSVVPAEVRGVHVTMGLASLPGKLEQYLAFPGLNTIELDVKDENGRIGFVPSTVPISRRIGAAGPFYKARQVARLVHAYGDYLIGRVVTFEDPILSEKRPDLAIHTSDGSLWHNNAGLGWTNPYDRRVWRYDVDVAVAAATAGFDEIQFDYVRFPSDGDVSLIRYPGAHPQPMRWTIPAFTQYAAARLHPLGVRVSVDVFGLSAARDLGIGQMPRRLSRYVDAVYPMVYPSHYHPGEYGIDVPDNRPATTVSRSLSDFRRALEGRQTRLTPWLQDFSLGRTYTTDDVRLQIAAARAQANGFLLWNPVGVYHAEVLLP